MGDAARPSPIPPPCGYRSTRPLRRHPPFGLGRNHLFAYTLRPPRYYNEFIIGPGAPSSPLRGTATRLFSIGVGPVLWRRVFLMYARTTSLLKLYIRNIIPGDVGSSVRRPWPIGVGDWSELCIASGTFRETMGRRTGVSALRNPGGAQPDVY